MTLLTSKILGRMLPALFPLLMSGMADASTGLESIRISGETQLESLAQRALERQHRPKGGLDIDRLSIGVEEGALPARVVIPVPAESGHLAKRVGAFVTGVVRWVKGRLSTDGISAGADLDMNGTAMVGIAAGYVDKPGSDTRSLKARTLSVYASHMDENGLRAHLVAGSGRARMDMGEEALRAEVQFGEFVASWEYEAAPGLTVAPELRLGATRARALGSGRRKEKGAATAVDVLLGLSATHERWVEAGYLELAGDVEWRTRMRGNRRDRSRPAPSLVQLDGVSAFQARTVLRLGASLTRPGGTVLSLVHAVDPAGGAAQHALRAGVRLTF